MIHMTTEKELLYKEEVNGERRVNRINLIIGLIGVIALSFNSFITNFHKNSLSNFTVL